MVTANRHYSATRSIFAVCFGLQIACEARDALKHAAGSL